MPRPYTKHQTGWLDTYLRGAAIARELPAQMTLRQVARELRVDHKSVYFAQCIALGKVALRLQQQGWCT